MRNYILYFKLFQDSKMVFVGLMFLSLAIFVLRAIISNGTVFREVFQHYDLVDTGMDFFNSIVCTGNGEPYKIFKTLYPPLANLFFYACYLCIPEQLTSSWNVGFENFTSLRNGLYDLRTWQHSLVIFLVYVEISLISFYLMIDSLQKKSNKLFNIALLFSFGMLFALERGNIIVLACIFMMFFVKYYGNSNKYLRELSILALSIAVGLKVYPIVFSVLILKDKKYIDFLKFCIYCLLTFIVPFYVFNGLADIFTWIETAKYVGTRNEMAIGVNYFGFTQVLKGVLVNQIIQPYISQCIDINFILNLSRYFCTIIAILLMLNAYLSKNKWKSLLSAALVIVVSQQHSPIYNTIFIIPAFIEFINENNKFNCNNICYFISFFLLLLPWPSFGFYKAAYIIRVICLFLLTVKMISEITLSNINFFKYQQKM